MAGSFVRSRYNVDLARSVSEWLESDPPSRGLRGHRSYAIKVEGPGGHLVPTVVLCRCSSKYSGFATFNHLRGGWRGLLLRALSVVAGRHKLIEVCIPSRPPADWVAEVERILLHEFTHVADPYIAAIKPGDPQVESYLRAKNGRGDYHAHPFERTAFVGSYLAIFRRWRDRGVAFEVARERVRTWRDRGAISMANGGYEQFVWGRQGEWRRHLTRLYKMLVWTYEDDPSATEPVESEV